MSAALGGGWRTCPRQPVEAAEPSDVTSSGGTSRYCRANRAMSRNAGAATTPPKIGPAARRSDEDDQPRRRRRARCRRRRRRTACRVAAAAGRASPPCPSCRRRGSRHGGLRRRCRSATTSCSIAITARRRPARRSAAAARFGSRAPRDVVDEVRLDPDAAVRERAVHRGHLDRRDRDPLADRDVADRRARPLVGREHDPGALAGEVDPGRAGRSRSGRSTLARRVAAEQLARA